VIHVTVGDPDCFQLRPAALDSVDETISFTAWIDDYRFVRAIIDDDVAVLLERADGESLDVQV
jgi:hypothetical protein